MPRWLVKEEPSHYSFDDLSRDRTTEWSGVHNALALRHLKGMRPDDEVFYYHSGTERAIVGIARVSGVPRADPTDERGSWSVTIRAERPLRRPVGLAVVKADPSLAGFDLVRIGRLSVMPVSDTQWSRLLSYEAGADPPGQRKAAARRPRRRRAASRKRGST